MKKYELHNNEIYYSAETSAAIIAEFLKKTAPIVEEVKKEESVMLKTCKRCGGSGNHSYNALDGTMCYGCSGVGTIAVYPNGRKVKATAEKHKAVIGDIIDQGYFYQVLEIKDLEAEKIVKGFLCKQVLILQNIVNKKYIRLYR